MLDSLHHLLLAVEHGTFTAAARRAHLSQPALTASIQRLEERFGARLLDRGRHGARATAAGEALLPYARAALTAVEDGRRAVAEVEGLVTGEVNLGAGATACAYLLPETIAAFRRAHPGVRFRMREATTGGLLRLLEAGRIDLAITHGPPPGRFDGEPWLEDELILVGPVEGDRPTTYVSFVEGSPVRALLLEHVPDAEIVMELASIATVKANVQSGVGLALVSRVAVRLALAEGRLAEVPHPATPIRRVLWLAHRGPDRLPPAVAALRDLLLDSSVP